MSPVILNPYMGAAGGGGGRMLPVTANLVLWAARGTKQYTTTAETTLATSNGDTVKRWVCNGGTNNALGVGTGSPTLDTSDTYLGNPTVNTAALTAGIGFPLLNSGRTALDLSALTAGEIFIVLKVLHDPATGAGNALWLFGTDGQNNFFPYLDGVIYDGFGSTARKTTGNPTTSLSGGYNVYNAYSAAGDWQSFLNNTSFFSTGTNTVGFLSACSICNGGGDQIIGHVVEIVLYSAKLSSGDRTSVYNFLTT